jgi:hypothetical protein
VQAAIGRRAGERFSLHQEVVRDVFLDEHRVAVQFWIDGFLPATVANTKHGVDVEGTVWVGDGPRAQYQFYFVVSVPQTLLHRNRQGFSIGNLLLDIAQQMLQIEVVTDKQVT